MQKSIFAVSIWIAVLLCCAIAANAQEQHTEICIKFRVNSTAIDSDYKDNAVRIREIVTALQDIRRDSTASITGVSFSGAASPEGSGYLNRRLAQGRLAILENLVRSEVDLPDSIVTRSGSYIPWGYLKMRIADSDLPWKHEAMAILEDTGNTGSLNTDEQNDRTVERLKRLRGGSAWRQMDKLFFEDMRNACVVLVTYKKETLPPLACRIGTGS